MDSGAGSRRTFLRSGAGVAAGFAAGAGVASAAPRLHGPGKRPKGTEKWNRDVDPLEAHEDAMITGAWTFPAAGVEIGGASLYASPGGGIGAEVLRLTQNTHPSVAPTIQFFGVNGAWLSGIDVASSVGGRDFALASKINDNGTVHDIIFLNHRGNQAPSIGMGFVPADDGYRLTVAGQAAEPEMGVLQLCAPAVNPTGRVLNIINSAGTPQVWIDSEYRFNAKAGSDGLEINAEGADDRALTLRSATGGNRWNLRPTSDGTLGFRHLNTGRTVLQLGGDSSLRHTADKLGFYSSSPVTRPTGVAATAADIHAALVELGLIAA